MDERHNQRDCYCSCRCDGWLLEPFEVRHNLSVAHVSCARHVLVMCLSAGMSSYNKL